MPKLKAPKAQPQQQKAPPKAKADAVVDDRPVQYPEIAVNSVPIPEENLTVDDETMKRLLGWETEEDYAKRAGAEKGAVTFKDCLLVDCYGKKVICWNNTNNRPFTESWALAHAQNILEGKWAFNCETMVISRTGQVVSAQHRGIGFILACQMWEQDPGRYPYWKERPTIKALVAFGCSDEQDVLDTIDNTRPQAPSDAFFRSPMFRSRSVGERKELSRMNDAAVDLLWKRTGYGKGRYLTVPEATAFAKRHGDVDKKSLFSAVCHVFEENNERAISLLKLSPGAVAGMLYLMSASDDDGDNYRKQRSPGQDDLQLKRWDDAEEFVSLLATVNGPLGAVRAAICALHEEEKGGRAVEKAMIIARAWSMWKTNKKTKFTKDMFQLKWESVKDKPDAPPVLVSDDNFGGIDLGFHGDPDDEELTDKERIAKAKEEQQKKIAEMNERIRNKKAKEAEEQPETFKAAADRQMAEFEKAFPGRFLAVKSKTAGYQFLNGNATKAAVILKVKTTSREGVTMLAIPDKEWDAASKKLLAAKLKLAYVERVKTSEKGEEEARCRDLFDAK